MMPVEQLTLDEFLAPPWHYHEVDNEDLYEVVDAEGDVRGVFFDEQMVDYIIGLVNAAHGLKLCCGGDH